MSPAEAKGRNKKIANVNSMPVFMGAIGIIIAHLRKKTATDCTDF
jgi:hypothetical protein